VGLGTTGGCLYFKCEQARRTQRGCSSEIASRELSGCRLLLSEIAIVLLLINPPCKSTLKQGQNFIHQRLPLKAALLSLSLPTDALCFPGDSILSRNRFQSSVGLRRGNGLVLWLLSHCQLMKNNKTSSQVGETNRILYSLFICAAFHPFVTIS